MEVEATMKYYFAFLAGPHKGSFINGEVFLPAFLGRIRGVRQ